MDNVVLAKMIQQLPDCGAITSTEQAAPPSISNERFDSSLIEILDREPSSSQPLP